MSSTPSQSTVGGVDLESILNVRRRRLSSIGETSLPIHQYRCTDTIYLKREDNSNSLLSINSKIHIYGDLQFLYNIFERYTSNIIIYEESIGSNSHKTSISTTFEENEEDPDTSALTSTLNDTSINSQSSSSPPKFSDTSIRRKTLSSVGRSQTIISTASDYISPNLEGKRYGCIQLPTMNIIEILEILLRVGLEIVNQSSDYDKDNILHQNFVFSKPSPKSTQSSYSRTLSFASV